MPGNSRSNSRSNSNTTGAGGQGRDESRGGRVSKQVGSSRKRSQNRIAQQCLRERRAAHDRHVGQVMKTLDSASEAGQSRRYDTLLESHLKLARHCQLLEDALFDLRKKLLGLSNSASMAADNSVFDLILGRIDQTDSPHVSSTDITPTFERTDATGDATQKGQETQGTQETCAGTGIDDVALWPGPGADASNDMFGDFSSVPLVSAPHAFHPRAISRDANVHMGPHLQPDTFATDWTSSLFATSDSFTLVDASAERSDPSADPSADPSTRRRDVGMPQSYVGCPWDILARPTSQKISIQSCSTFNNTVLRAAMRCVPRVHVLPGLLHLNTEQVAQQVSVAAVNLIITASGMQHYSYGINAAAYMERILYWRLGGGAPNVVPDPFRPTALQSDFSMPNLVIDFLCWPAIRDQIIRAGSALDLDELCRSILLNTVVEIPQHQIAINVSQHFRGRALSRCFSQGDLYAFSSSPPPLNPSSSSPGVFPKAPSSVMDPCWVFFEISRDDVDFEPSMPDPVEEAMTKELCRRVERFSRSRPLSLFSGAQHQHSELLEALQSPLALLDPQFGQDEMITPYGIPNTRAWKLSKQFQEKYHFIDCSSACTSYETVI